MEHDTAIPRPGDELIIRGLEARIAWSNYERCTDDQQRDETGRAAIRAAYTQGKTDFGHGLSKADMPLLLADLPDRAEMCALGWRMGWAGEDESWGFDDEYEDGDDPEPPF